MSSLLAYPMTCHSGTRVTSRRLQFSYVISCLHSFILLSAEVRKLQHIVYYEEVSLSKLQLAEGVSGSWEWRATQCQPCTPQQAATPQTLPTAGRAGYRATSRDHWQSQTRWWTRHMVCLQRDPVLEDCRGAAARVPPAPQAGLAAGTPHHPGLSTAGPPGSRGRGWLGPSEAVQGHSDPLVPSGQAAHSSDSILQLQYDSS